jgi:RimJ/RimL family protein N-acetyltransferase
MLTLRPLTDDDLDALFAWENDARALELAAFTRPDRSRGAFDAQYVRIRSDPDCTLRAIDDDGEFVGTIGSFTIDGEREVTYWIWPERWGQGIASRALLLFLADVEHTRPIRGRVAEHNLASAKVLERAGFAEVGTDTGYAAGVGRDVVERIYRLDS